MPKGLEGDIYIHSPLQNGIRKNSLGVDNISSSWQLNNKVKQTLLRRFISYLCQTIQTQYCLIQSDVEQLLGVSSAHNFTLVYLISSHLLLKAANLDWVEIYFTHLEYDQAEHILSMIKLFIKSNGKLLVCLNTTDTISISCFRAFNRYYTILSQYTFCWSSEYFGTT